MPSCCKQVRDFLDFGRDLHAEVRKLYIRLGDSAEQERVRMLLEFLERHEQHMVQTLGRFEQDSHAGLPNGWLEYSPALDVDSVIAQCQLSEQSTIDDIMAAAMRFDETLVRLYQEMAEKAVDQRTRDLFKDLVNLEQQEKISVSRAAMSLADM